MRSVVARGLVCLVASPASSLTQELRGSLALPTLARAAALALVPEEPLVVVGTRRRAAAPELFVVEFEADGANPRVRWSLDLGGHARAVVVDGGLAYVATSDDTAELVVVDLDRRAVAAVLDAPGTGDGDRLSVVEPGEVLLERRPGDGPERYRLAWRDGGLVVLESAEAPWAGRMPRPSPLCGHRIDRGRVVARVRRIVPGGALHVLLTTDRRAAVQIVAETVPVVFPDVDGDGLYRLACLGDSNTARYWPLWKWCEQLVALVGDRHFTTLNLAVNGATVATTPAPLASTQMDAALSAGVDAVVAAFGTNDVFWMRPPSEIRDAYVALRGRAEAAGVAFFAATMPPCIGCPACTAETNVLLREAFPGRLVDFDTGFTAEHFFADGYHLNQTGQDLWARRAYEALRAPAP